MIKKLGKKQLRKINKWIKFNQEIRIDFPNETAQILNLILENYILKEKKPIYHTIASLPTFSR